jgi:hypothetical protein
MLYDNPKLQRHMKNDPEGTEEFLRMIYKAEGSDSGFNTGGVVPKRGLVDEPGGYAGDDWNPNEFDKNFDDMYGREENRKLGRSIPGKILGSAGLMGVLDFLDVFGTGGLFNKGGRVGLFMGGVPAGIMQAVKLAQKGIKPFGAKQTYKQQVTNKGVSEDQFDDIFKKQLDRVPDEVVDDATAHGLKKSLDEAEDILIGVKFGLLNQAQRTKIANAMTDKVKKQIYKENSGLGNEYLEYMDDSVLRMEDLLEIEKLGGDLTPKPIPGAPEYIQPDFTQLTKLRNKGPAEIIPFKPRKKKAMGGQIGVGSLFRSK